MNWTRSETIALAQNSCTSCLGLGLRMGRSDREAPCNCVFRAIFRACFNRFRHCIEGRRFSRSVYAENTGTRNRVARTYGFRNEEFIADFIMVSKRILGENTLAWRLFRYHFLLGADWRLCTKKLGLNRGEFFHEVYRVQQELGRAFRELRPHALFPLDEYFSSSSPQNERTAALLPLQRCQLRVPMQSAAGL